MGGIGVEMGELRPAPHSARAELPIPSHLLRNVQGTGRQVATEGGPWTQPVLASGCGSCSVAVMVNFWNVVRQYRGEHRG